METEMDTAEFFKLLCLLKQIQQ